MVVQRVTIGTVLDVVPSSSEAVDGLPATDSVSRALSAARTAVDGAGIPDAIGRVLTAARTVVDAAGASDSVGGSLTPGWVKPVMGTMGSNETTFQQHDAAYGPVLARRTYDGSLPASWAASAAASDVAGGRHSYWSFKPSVTSFPTDTAAKNAFSAFLDTIPAGHPATIIAWHEPENDIENGDWTLAQWGALQDAVGAIVQGKNRPELRFGICLMGPWTFDTRSGRTSWDWEGALNWSLVDVFGIDPYRTTAGSTYSLEQILTVNNSGSGTGGSAPSMFAKLATFGKPIALMEWGCYNTAEADVAAWITAAYAWMKVWNQGHLVTPIEAALWFDYTLTGSDNPLTGVEITAYAAVVADSKIPPS